jgi:hypothetical protein
MSQSFTKNIPLSDNLSDNSSFIGASQKAVNDGLALKQNTLTNPVTGTGTANEIAYFPTSSTVGSLAVATYPSLTELSYVKGLTSALQTQLNARVSQEWFISGQWNGPILLTSNTSLTGFNGSAFYTPFVVGKTTVFTDIGIPVTTGVAAATVRIGIYNSANGVPTTVAYQSGALDASSTGLKSETISGNLTLTPGVYFRVAQTSAAGVSVLNGSTPTLITNPTNSANQFGRVEGRAYGAFTNNPTTSYHTTQVAAAVLIKAQ